MHPKVAALESRLSGLEAKWAAAEPVWDAVHVKLTESFERIRVLEETPPVIIPGGLAADDEAALGSFDARMEALDQKVADATNTKTVANA